MSCMVRLFKKSCGICKVQDVDLIKYENRSGIRMVFCDSCKNYAEKRSFKEIKRLRGKKNKVAHLSISDSKAGSLRSN